VKHGDLDKVRDSLAKLFAKVNQSLSPVMLRQVWHELLVTIFRLVRENALCLTAILNDEEQNDAYFERFSSIPSMKDWFEQKFANLIQESQNQNVKNYSFSIRQAIIFLEEHYREEINLEVLARQVGLSKNHLCTLFRIETGRNFIDYLHQIRISQAKGLLETTDLRVSEVGLNVGYHDAKYFAKVFQKYQNCSPSEYRQINH
jgi:two-component system response regulator YesN